MAPFGSVPGYGFSACAVGDGFAVRLTPFPSMRRHERRQ